MASYTDLLGTKYKTHGRSKEEGFDCYGLAIEVLRRNCIELPDLYYDTLRQSYDVSNEIKARIVEKIPEPMVNCIVGLRSRGIEGHMGVYIGDGMFIHTTIGSKVCIEPLWHWKDRIEGYYKVISYNKSV